MTDKEKTIIDRANILKEKINMCFILFLNKLETIETIERTIYEHLDAFVDEWNDLFQRKEQECEELKEEKAEIKKYLGISSKTILERLEELQERRDELSDKNLSYEQALDNIIDVIRKLNGDSILTFPDLSKEENYKLIMKQCNEGYVEILNIINKAKDGNNEQL